MPQATYQQILEALDDLTTSELVTLMTEISYRLQNELQDAGIEMEDYQQPSESSRRYLPRLSKMIEWTLVLPMKDKLFVRNHPEHPVLLLDDSNVVYQGETMSINDWAKKITGWKSVNVYEWVLVERTGLTLDQMRRNYMDEH